MPNTGASGDEELWEWRSLSVMFCDLVGSTKLIEALDEETYATALRRYYAICTEAVRAASGMVAQYQGDGVICQFGWPYATEDDAVRALRAASAIVDAVGTLTVPGRSEPMAARVGIASGRIKLRLPGGDFGTGAIGASLHRASRLQSLAPPGGVIACEVTRKLAGDQFEYREMRDQVLKGFDSPETVFRVLRERAERTTRFDALRGRRAKTFVGRDAELASLIGKLRDARAQKGSAVTLAAPAGYGKSRILSAFKAHPDAQGCRVFTLQCVPEAQATPLHPVREFVEWSAGALRRHSPEARHERLNRLFSTVWGVGEPALSDMLDLLSPTGSGNAPDEDSTMLVRRRRAFAALRDQIFRSAEDAGGLVFVVEDLHWADASTHEFLSELTAEVANRPVLVIATTRPEGATLAGSSVIELSPLSSVHAAELARAAAGSRELRTDVMKTVIERAEGVPLFIEEYAEMLTTTGEGGGSNAPRVPLSLDAIVRSRLDRLPPMAAALADAGAAFGRRFPCDAAGAVAGFSSEDAHSAAQHLVDARLAEYATDDEKGDVEFSHGLIRDAVYSAMDEKRRRTIHGRIVAYLKEDGARVSGGDDVVAEHLFLAGRPQEAIDRFVSAAMASTKIGAVAEAIRVIERALEVLETLPAGPDRDAFELRIRAIQGPTLMVMRGPGAPAFGAAQSRANELLQRLDMRAEAVPVVYNSALHAWARGDLARAEELARELDEIERDTPSDGGYMASHTMHGLVAWHEGRNEDAKFHLKAVVGRYEADKHRDLYTVFLKEFGVFAQFYLGLTLTVLGDEAGGQAAANRSVELARVVRRPHAIGFGMLANFNAAILRGDFVDAERWAHDAFAFSSEQGFPEFMAMSRFCLGWVACQRGDRAEGIVVMEEGAAFWNMTGFASWQPVFAGLLACEAAAGGALEKARDWIRRFSGSPELQAAAPLALARALVAEAEGNTPAAWADASNAARIAMSQGGRAWLRRIETAFPGVSADQTVGAR